DPLQLEPRLSRFRRHVIHPSPTLEQQFFVLAEYLGNTSVRSVHAVIRGEEAVAVADVLRRSLVTFGGSLRSPAVRYGCRLRCVRDEPAALGRCKLDVKDCPGVY
ncbi:receptor-type adenylate cyclase, partial [Trypanosoma rangeli]